MTAYLANGWFTSVGPRRLRAEVVDGAIDAATALQQAEAPPALLAALVLRLRTMALLLRRDRLRPSPLGTTNGREFDHHERTALRAHLVEATDAHVGLQAFVTDCLEHVGDAAALEALYLHLLHISHLVRLLAAAKGRASELGVPKDLLRAAAKGPGAAVASWHAPR